MRLHQITVIGSRTSHWNSRALGSTHPGGVVFQLGFKTADRVTDQTVSEKKITDRGSDKKENENKIKLSLLSVISTGMNDIQFLLLYGLPSLLRSLLF